MEPSGFSLAPQTRIGLSVIARRQAKNAVEHVDVHPGGQPIVGSVITGGVRDQIVNERQPQAIPANHTVGDAGGRISRWQSIAKVPKMPISALPEIAGARSDENLSAHALLVERADDGAQVIFPLDNVLVFGVSWLLSQSKAGFFAADVRREACCA